MLPQFVPTADNAFATLSLIVAPAVLTNASTVLVLSTSNRLARINALRITEEPALLLLRALPPRETRLAVDGLRQNARQFMAERRS